MTDRYITNDGSLVDVILSLRELASKSEVLLRGAVGIPAHTGPLDFSYVNHHWSCKGTLMHVITQDLAAKAASSTELDAFCSVVPGSVSVILCETDYEYLNVRREDGRDVWFVLRRELCGLRPPGSYREGW